MIPKSQIERFKFRKIVWVLPNPGLRGRMPQINDRWRVEGHTGADAGNLMPDLPATEFPWPLGQLIF